LFQDLSFSPKFVFYIPQFLFFSLFDHLLVPPFIFFDLRYIFSVNLNLLRVKLTTSPGILFFNLYSKTSLLVCWTR
jgi:hypothetical protein